MGAFDDLVPAAPRGGAFDDLIPKDTGIVSTIQNALRAKAIGGAPADMPVGENLTRAVTDIPGEIKDAGGSALTSVNNGLNPFSESSRANFRQQLEAPSYIDRLRALASQYGNVGSGLASVPAAAAAPLTGAVRATGGHLISAGLNVPYAEGKDMAETAASAMAPRRGSTPMPRAPEVPTAEELKATAQAGYRSPEVAALEVNPQAIQNWATGTRAALDASGRPEVLTPQVHGVLKIAEKAEPGAVATGGNLETIRQTLNQASRSSDSRERGAAKAAIDAFDQFMSDIPERSILKGDAGAAADTLSEARGNYAAAKRDEKITGALDKAELDAGATHSGLNLDNRIRQRLKSLLQNEKAVSGYTPDEVAQIRTIVEGGKVANVLRRVSNLLGGGGGLGAAAVGKMLGPAAPVIGAGLKRLENVLARSEVEKLSEVLRARSPVAEQQRQQFEGAMAAWEKAQRDFNQAPSYAGFVGVANASHALSEGLRVAGVTAHPMKLLGISTRPMGAGAEEDQRNPSAGQHP